MARRKKKTSALGLLSVAFLGVAGLFSLAGRVNPPQGSEEFRGQNERPEVTSLSQTASEPLPQIQSSESPSSDAIGPGTPPTKSGDTLLVPVDSPKEIDLGLIQPVSLYARLDLGMKGFELKRNDPGSRACWILRKTDADREYSGVFLLGPEGKVSAITLELVGSQKTVDEQAQNYFQTMLASFVSKNHLEEIQEWLLKDTEKNSSYSSGQTSFVITHASHCHRRLTIQPEI